MGLVVDVELAHEVEFVSFDRFDAELEAGGNLFHGLAFRQHFENLALALGEGAEPRLARRPAAALHAEIVHQAGQETRAEITAAVMHLANGGEQLIGGTLPPKVAAELEKTPLNS